MSSYLGNSETMNYANPLVITEQQFNSNIENDAVPGKAYNGGNIVYYTNSSDINLIDQNTEFALFNPEQQFYYYFIKE